MLYIFSSKNEFKLFSNVIIEKNIYVSHNCLYFFFLRELFYSIKLIRTINHLNTCVFFIFLKMIYQINADIYHMRLELPRDNVLHTKALVELYYHQTYLYVFHIIFLKIVLFELSNILLINVPYFH